MEHTPVLSDAAVEGFVRDGFVRVDHAFSRELADAVREILWRDSGCDPHDRATWTRPVVRLNEYATAPFVAAANAPLLRAAVDQIVGEGRWLPRRSIGSFPVRFPSEEDPGDAGWHVDTSFAGDDPNDYFSYRANVRSKGRALLMLMLFSDVSEHDAPTRIRVGSHRIIARMLASEGEHGLSFMEIASRLDATSECPVAHAIGEAGTVYLCHPFLVHAAQKHRGSEARFMAQPPLFPSAPLQLERADGAYSAVERAIREALLPFLPSRGDVHTNGL